MPIQVEMQDPMVFKAEKSSKSSSNTMTKLLLILVMGLWSGCGGDYATQTNVDELAQDNVALQERLSELSVKLDSLLRNATQETQGNIELRDHVNDLSVKLDSLLESDFQKTQGNIALEEQLSEVSAKLDSLLGNDIQEAQTWVQDISTRWAFESRQLSSMSFSEYSGIPNSIMFTDPDLLVHTRVFDDGPTGSTEQFQYYRDSENNRRIHHGWYSRIYERDGVYAAIGQYEHGLKEGAWLYFSLWGWMSMAEFYEKGELNGSQVVFYSDSIIARTEPYVKGVLNGIAVSWHPNGQQESIEHYENGEVIYRSYFAERVSFPLERVHFLSNDNILIRGIFAHPDKAQKRPVIIILHDLGGKKTDAWNFGGNLVTELIDKEYAVLAIDLRGHGNTPLPDDREVLELVDLENSFLDVHAALTWLQSQDGADANRVAVIGNGSGGNVAYVSLGVFPEQIKTGIILSPGLWEVGSLTPLVVGDGINPFEPQSMLYMVGDKDQIQGPDTTLSYVDFARNLEALTDVPKDLQIFQNSTDHGFELLNNVPEALDLLLVWLETIL
jgi:dienelactone hydrolase